jgi:hypothetical protein
MKLHRSSYYYRPKGLSLWEQKQEADLQDRIEQLVCEFPGYGYRRVTKQLHREGLQVISKCQQNFLLEGKMNFPDLLPSNPMHSSYQREVPPEGMMNAHYRKWLRYPLSL